MRRKTMDNFISHSQMDPSIFQSTLTKSAIGLLGLLLVTCTSVRGSSRGEAEAALGFFCDHIVAAGLVQDESRIWLEVSKDRNVNFTALRLLKSPHDLTLEMIKADQALDDAASEIPTHPVETTKISRCNFEVLSHNELTEVGDALVVMSVLLENPHATAPEFQYGFFMTITSIGGGAIDYWVPMKDSRGMLVPAAVVALDTDD